MKKAVSFILALVFCFGLCACTETGNSPQNTYADIQRELVGTWEGKTNANFNSNKEDSENFYTYLSFSFKEDGTFTAHSQLIHKSVGTVDTKNYSGTYKIKDGTIELDPNIAGVLKYTYQSGTLSVYTDEYKLNKNG